MDTQHPIDPEEAHREGLEELEQPHHATTQHDKPLTPSPPQPTNPQGDPHRGGPLPYVKR